MDILEEMDKFLEGYNFPRLNWEEIENMNERSQVLQMKLWLKDFWQT